MNIPGLGTTTFPATGYTNNGVLFTSLGTFWTRIFTDKEAIRGLTLGQSEELIQRYYEFVDAVASLSVKDIPELHKERWTPIKIRKSALRRVPLRFLPAEDPDHAVFGPQPLPQDDTERNNLYHYGETFQFGRGKRPAEDQYFVDIDPTIKQLPLLVNRIVAPSQTLVSGTDFWLENGKLYFNRNPFNLPETMRYLVFDEDGKQLTYTPPQELYTYTPAATAEFDTQLNQSTGVVEEEELVLWAYHAAYDIDTLHNSFGYIFQFKDPDPKTYKLILEKTVNFFVEGPTVQAFTAMAGAFVGVQTVEDKVETLLDAYTVDDIRYVITDKRVYTADSFYAFSNDVYNYDTSAVKVGAKLASGTTLFDAVQYFDKLVAPSWWLTQLSRLSLPPYLFLGSYAGVMVFENLTGNDRPTLETILPSPGVVAFPFPTQVLEEDKERFNTYLSEPSRYPKVAALLTAYADANDGRINPLDFIFKYFMETNTAMIKLKFKTLEQAAKFMKFFRVVKDCLPKYLYLLFFFDFSMLDDEGAFLVNAIDASTLSSDGSDLNGWVQVPPYNDPPWTVFFGEPAVITAHVRPFVISRSLDLYTTYTGGYGTYYQNTNGLAGNADILQDIIELGVSYKDGQDANNISLSYPMTGTIDIANESTTINGDGTSFLTEFNVGDWIYSRGDTEEYRQITSIEQQDVLTINAEFSGTSRTIPLWKTYDKPSMSNTSGLIFWRL